MSQLATKFASNRIEVRARDGFLTEAEIRRAVPAAFAESAHPSRSERYAYIPTSEIIAGYAKEGFRPTFAYQARPRNVDRHGFTKHMLRFRRESDIGKGEAAEIIAINSHGGETSLQLIGGVYRFVCANGLVVGDEFEEVRVRHSPKMIPEAIDGAYRVVDSFDRVRATVDTMKAIGLSLPEQMAFAESAATLRFDLAEGEAAPVRAEQFNRPRRTEDAGADLWTTFNRVQENTIRGGLHGVARDANNRQRRITTREVAGIDQGTALNRALWTLAQKMAELKGA